MLMRHTPVTQATEAAPDAKTFTGNRGLEIEEGLIFETGRPENTGVDLDEPLPFKHRLGSLERARGGAPLCAAVTAELRDRRRDLSARLLHDEA
jgi:hypothetical protein